VPKPVQTKFASYHCVGVQVSDTQIMSCFGNFFREGNNITGDSNRGGEWA